MTLGQGKMLLGDSAGAAPFIRWVQPQSCIMIAHFIRLKLEVCLLIRANQSDGTAFILKRQDVGRTAQDVYPLDATHRRARALTRGFGGLICRDCEALGVRQTNDLEPDRTC